MDYLQYQNITMTYPNDEDDVLNLVINGLPSIRYIWKRSWNNITNGFKPCYKWITFNTIISHDERFKDTICFKPCYKWITFNTIKKALEV